MNFTNKFTCKFRNGINDKCQVRGKKTNLIFTRAQLDVTVFENSSFDLEIKNNYFRFKHKKQNTLRNP